MGAVVDVRVEGGGGWVESENSRRQVVLITRTGHAATNALFSHVADVAAVRVASASGLIARKQTRSPP